MKLTDTVALAALAMASAPALAAPPKIIDRTIRVYAAEVREEKGNKTFVKWTPSVNFYIQGKNEPDDLVWAQFLEGGKKLGKPFKCVVPSIEKEDDQTEFRCEFPDDYATSKTGRFVVVLDYLNVVDNQKTPGWRTLTFDVMATKGWPEDVGSYKVNYDYLLEGVYLADRDRGKGTGDVVGEFWYKHLGDKNPKSTVVRCWHEGKRLPYNMTSQHFHNDFDYPYYKGKKTQIEVKWSSCEMNMSSEILVQPREDAHFSEPKWYLSEHPGKYECKVWFDGEIVRVFRFTANKDGKIAPQAEQDPAHADALFSTTWTFVETDIIENGFETLADAPINRKLVKELAWGGRGFKYSAPSFKKGAEAPPSD